MLWSRAPPVCRGTSLIGFARMPEWRGNNEIPCFTSQSLQPVPGPEALDGWMGIGRPCWCHILEHRNSEKPMVCAGMTGPRQLVIIRQWAFWSSLRPDLKIKSPKVTRKAWWYSGVFHILKKKKYLSCIWAVRPSHTLAAARFITYHSLFLSFTI